MRINLKLNKFYLNIFAILNLLGLLSSFVDIKLGVLSSIIILIICFAHLKTKLFFSDRAFVIYILACVVSGISYIWNGRPFTIYLAAISFNVFPAFLVYLGRFIASRDETDTFVLRMLNSFIFMMGVGTVAYLFFSSFYYEYLGQPIESYTYGLGEYRYGSFISSIALGSVGSISIALYFNMFERISTVQRVVYLPLIILNLLMCMQRSAWIISIFSLIICIFVEFSNSRKSRLRIIGIIIVFLVIAVFVWAQRQSIFSETQLLYFESRISVVNISDMVSSRNNQWIEAWNKFIENPLIGYGLGSLGQKAAPYGLAIVTDGNHLRILAEIGIFGFGAFVYMNLRAIIRSIKAKRYYFVIIIVLCNIAAVGSPIFDQYYASFAYWLILGCASIKIKKQ